MQAAAHSHTTAAGGVGLATLALPYPDHPVQLGWAGAFPDWTMR